MQPQPENGSSNKRWLILISTVLMLVLSTIIYIQLHQSSLLSNTLRYEEDNISWSFFQLEAESQRFREALQKAAHKPEEIDTDTLQLRLDIFYSRYKVVTEGKGLNLLSEYQDNVEALHKIEEFFDTFDHYFHEGGAGKVTIGVIRNMLDGMEELRQPLHDISLAANLMAGARAEYRANEVKRQITISTGLILFQCLLTLLFSYIVIRQIRQLEESQERLSSLAGQLEQSNDQLHDRATALATALEAADRSYAELSSYTAAIDQHAQVTVMDLDGRIIQANDRYCVVTGYNREELIGQEHQLLDSGLHPEILFNELWKTIRQGDIWRGEICNRAKDGSLHWADTAIVPLKSAPGQILRFISVGIDISEQKEAEQRASYMATHDALTGLPNHNLLRDRMRQVLARDRRDRKLAAVLFIDLDEFKVINDTLGHEVGDLLLKEVADRLASSVRGQDTVARQSGDEFTVLLPDIGTAQNARLISQKLLDELRPAFHVNGRQMHIGASIGIAIFPDDGSDVETLLKNSDIAMYHAKASGRGNCQFFAPHLNEVAEKTQRMTSDLRQALVRNEFFLNYQPLIHTADGGIDAMEALLRWQHPQEGMLLPAQFVPVAEESGLIVPIGEWVLQSACEQIRSWLEQGHEVPRLFINLSARQCCDTGFVDMVARVLRNTGVEARNLGFEVNEAVLIEQGEEAAGNLQRLHEMGLQIAIDNFGASNSSLGCLKRFPVDRLKINSVIVQEMAGSPDSQRMVSAIIGMARGMQVHVVAEGVETKEQLDFLRQSGCQQCQGYYFGKPLLAAEMAGWFGTGVRPLQRQAVAGSSRH